MGISSVGLCRRRIIEGMVRFRFVATAGIDVTRGNSVHVLW